MPVASKTRPLYVWSLRDCVVVRDAEDVEQAGQRLGQPAGAARDDGAVDERARRRCSARAGWGSGRPRFLTSSLPIGDWT